jgi:polysaccharide deacetylase family protein (PEP-CTERM system associated)
MMQKQPTYLFSIDLEDVRFGLDNGNKYKERVSINTHKYLDWLDKYKFKCTFFVVGNIATHYPELIKEIDARGHEIGCHTNSHIPLDKRTPKTFKQDIETNIKALKDCGVNDIIGFRAPIFSLTKNTEWAYGVLNELGFKYSSSVLPAKNPLYGWEEFGKEIKKLENGLIEIPMTVAKFGPLTIPFAGGVYFRALPSLFINKKIKKIKNSANPLLGYFHPYDIDDEQEKFMMPGINNSKFYNWLMYYNRKHVFKRLDKIIKQGYKITTYKEYIKSL